MAYGDTETGQMRLETIIDPQSEEFREAWDAAKGEALRLGMGGEADDLVLKAAVKWDIERTAYEAFAKTDMRGEGWAWNFSIDDGILPLVRPFTDEGAKVRIASTAHWRVSDAGEYGKFLFAYITDFILDTPADTAL